jgi:hypothetical protein
MFPIPLSFIRYDNIYATHCLFLSISRDSCDGENYLSCFQCQTSHMCMSMPVASFLSIVGGQTAIVNHHIEMTRMHLQLVDPFHCCLTT